MAKITIEFDDAIQPVLSKQKIDNAFNLAGGATVKSAEGYGIGYPVWDIDMTERLEFFGDPPAEIFHPFFSV